MLVTQVDVRTCKDARVHQYLKDGRLTVINAIGQLANTLDGPICAMDTLHPRTMLPLIRALCKADIFISEDCNFRAVHSNAGCGSRYLSTTHCGNR